MQTKSAEVRSLCSGKRERVRERDDLAVQWGVAIDIERAIKKNASF